MDHYEKLELYMEVFVKYAVDYHVFEAMPEENTQKFIEKMTIDFCKRYSPTTSYGVAKKEIRVMFCDVFNYLNNPKHTFDLNTKNIYVYTSVKPFNKNKLIVAPTKKKAIELLSSLPYHRYDLFGSKSTLELVTDYEADDTTVVVIDKKGIRREITEPIRDAVINLYRNGVTLNEDDE